MTANVWFHRFKVKNDVMGKDNLIGWACIRLDRLQQGHRFIHLLDAKGIESKGVLLVSITKEMS
jgi:phosphatidylinositol phospholipase C delta